MRGVFLRGDIAVIDWNEVNTVFLDMDGTLLDLRFDNYFWLELLPERYARKNRVELAHAKKHLSELFLATEGTLEWYCLEYWSDRLQLDLLQLKLEVAGKISVLPHAREFLRKLPELGYRVVLLTNAHPGSLELKMRNTRLGRFFDAMISSHTLGWAKEQDGFWQQLGVVEPFDPGQALMVDDSLRVLDAAHRNGLGQLVAVRRPDSTLPPSVAVHDYPAIIDFRDLDPVI